MQAKLRTIRQFIGLIHSRLSSMPEKEDAESEAAELESSPWRAYAAGLACRQSINRKSRRFASDTGAFNAARDASD